MKIIIAGASGFIGKNLLLGLPRDWEIIALYHKSVKFLEFLKNNNLYNVKAYLVNLLNKEELKTLVNKFGDNYDYCVFLAANGDPAISAMDPKFDLESNTCTLLNFLDLIKVKRLIYFSSGAVYDGINGSVGPKTKVEPTLPYAISNLASEQYVKFYQGRRKTIKEYVIIRFFGAYGPYEPERKIYTKLLKNFALEKKTEFNISGDGNNLIDAMYVDDTIEGIKKVLESHHSNKIVDFACCSPLTINELVNRTANIFDIKNPTIYHHGTVPEYIKFKVDCMEFNSMFQFSPKFGVEEGLLKFKHFLEIGNND